MKPASRPGGSRRLGGFPRAVPVLTLLLAAAVLALVLTGRCDRAPVMVAGGPLFTLAPEEVEGLLVTSSQGQFRLDRKPGGSWTLSGAVSDFVDPQAMGNLLSTLTGAAGGPLLPGTEPQDRRYEFNGPGALRLVLFGPDGRREDLALGAVNPVTGMVYASGAGRPGCFTVPAALQATLAVLPDGVRVTTLLPRLPRGAVDAIDLERNGIVHRLRRHDGRWWLRVPSEGPGILGVLARSYQETYEDRRFTDGQGTWYLASEEEVGLLVHDVSRILVRRLVPAQEQDALRALGRLDQPWRRISLEGPGINPDPADSSPDRLTLAFGPPLENRLLPVLRRGNVLLADEEALISLDKPLADLLHLGALTFRAVLANEFVVWRQGQEVLAGSRPAGPLEADGRSQWVTTLPAAGQPGPQEVRRLAQAGELMIDLDRMAIVAVLPPTKDPAVLQDDQRVRVELVYREGGAGSGDGCREIFEVGYLNPRRADPGHGGSSGTVPGGAVPGAGGAKRRAALWRPQSGQVLEVEEQLLVTVRNLAAR